MNAIHAYGQAGDPAERRRREKGGPSTGMRSRLGRALPGHRVSVAGESTPFQQADLSVLGHFGADASGRANLDMS